MHKTRRGFTLIEVIAALGIFMIVLVAFLGSYYSYYRNVHHERYKTIGENLAQLQLEDIQNLSIGALRIIIGADSSSGKGYWPYDPENPNDTGGYFASINNYVDTVLDAPDPSVFDSEKIGGTFRVYRLEKNAFLEELDDPNSNIPGIGVDKEMMIDENGNLVDSGKYILTLYDNTIFPNYKKRIYIEDLTPDVPSADQKLFYIKVTVFWEENKIEKSVTVEGYKSGLQ